MIKNKFILFGAAIMLMSISSCGIFKKNCGCPHFGKIKSQNVHMGQYADVQMIG
jgi:hypothetical protein